MTRMFLAGLLALAVAGLGAGCSDEDDKLPITPPPTEKTYVGTDVCRGCHASEYAVFAASGHPNKITPVVNGQRPGAPLQLPDQPPAGLTWGQVKYIVGGWGWKARFVTMDDQVLIGENVQYNLQTDQFATAAWANYNVGKPTAFDYDCFVCHTTGPDEATDTFDQPGIQCEACHGPGSTHAASRRAADIESDDSAELCGRCHYRDPAKVRIIGGGGFINHHEQYEEMLDGPHRGLECVTCHDYHAGTNRGQNGIVRDCASCHPSVQLNHPAGPTCVQCHMPYAGRSARAVNKYQGDIRTHIFNIHGGPEPLASMFETVEGKTYVKQGYGVTLDFACYTCHQDGDGVGGSASARTLEELWSKAQVIHGTKAMAAR